jgi:1,2-phenylacetyl-CoA epoxidase PaaB subunit
VIRITASPARMYGVVHAADEDSALAKAIEQFQIKSPHEQKKLMVRPQR